MRRYNEVLCITHVSKKLVFFPKLLFKNLLVENVIFELCHCCSKWTIYIHIYVCVYSCIRRNILPTFTFKYIIYGLIWGVKSHRKGCEGPRRRCLEAVCRIFIAVRNVFSHSNFTNILSFPPWNTLCDQVMAARYRGIVVLTDRHYVYG